MSGYNRIEQLVGGALNRFPRVKRLVETTYQRVNYHLLADSDFTYEVNEAAAVTSVESTFGVDPGDDRFVGFYDVQPWTPSMDACFLHEVTGEAASILIIRDGTVDRVGETRAWNFQQGSRTHWHPGEDRTLLFNDLDAGTAVTRLVDLDGDDARTLPRPIQAVDPTGEGYLSIDYRRLDRNDPAYGYGESGAVPTDDGIAAVSFTGEIDQLVSMETLIDGSTAGVPEENHYVHHVRYSPDGTRFAFLHRWRDGNQRHTRLMVGNMDGEVRELLQHPLLSHFCWIDTDRLFLWGASDPHGRGYFEVDVDEGTATPMQALEGFGDGHPSVSPDGEWIATDTYPDRRRRRSLTLYHRPSDSVIPLGAFHAPFGFDGANRCDLHPRWGPNGQFISVDSTHEGVRRSYVVAVGDVLETG